MTDLPTNEYLQRIKIMQKKVLENDLDAILVFSTECESGNVRYFTNYWPIFETAGLFIPKEGEAILLIGPETETFAEMHSILKNYRKLVEFRESSDPSYPDIKQNTFTDFFKELDPIKKLGIIGSNIITLQVYEGIKKAIPKAEIKKSDELLIEMRMIKTDIELSLLKEAATIVANGFDAILGIIKPGMTEIQVRAECEYSVLSKGAEAIGFMPWCVSGKGTTQAIGRSTSKKIKKGEIIQISMGAMVGGYVSSFNRVITFGKIETEMKKLVDVVLGANELTHQLMKPGADASYIAKQRENFVEKHGMKHFLVYGPAHGIGVMECEFPFIETVSNFKLVKNMTFSVDNFLAHPNYGARIEDTVAITEYGEEQFAPFHRELIII